MILIGILIALALERMLGDLPHMGEPWALRWLVLRVQALIPIPKYWSSAAAPLVLVIAGTGLTLWLDLYLDALLLDLLFSVAVLFLCLGPRDLSNDVARLLRAREQHDEETEANLLKRLLLGPGRRKSRRFLIGALFIQSHERLFGVLLWFFLAGPAGAVAYRLASRMPAFLHDSQPGTRAKAMAQKLHAALAWWTARATAGLYMLAGSADTAAASWRTVNEAQQLDWRNRSWAVLSEVGSGALTSTSDEQGTEVPAQLDDCLREVVALQGRALLILLAFFALFTAGGWIT